jgi:hypothetical protein
VGEYGRSGRRGGFIDVGGGGAYTQGVKNRGVEIHTGKRALKLTRALITSVDVH